MRIPGSDQAIANIMKWASGEAWEESSQEVFDQHIGAVLERFDLTDEELFDLLGDASGMLFSFICEDLFAARFGEEGERNIVDDYLKRRGWREKVPAKRYVQALRDSVPSLYEIVDFVPGRSLTLRDLIREGDLVTVEERAGSKSATRWDRFAGRVVTVNGKFALGGGVLLFPREAAADALEDFEDMVKRARRTFRQEAKKSGEPLDLSERDLRDLLLETVGARHFSQTWTLHVVERALGPLPELRNSDGEEFVSAEVRFPVLGEEAALVRCLDAIESLERTGADEPLWAWLGPGSPTRRVARGRGKGMEAVVDGAGTILGHVEIGDGAVVLTVNSRERAEKGSTVLAAALEGLVGSPSTSCREWTDILEDDPEAAPGPPDIPPDVAEQILHAFMEDHLHQILDDPIPVLGDKSPRQAVRSKKGRAQVLDWLKGLENTESRRAAAQGQKPYDMAWMWQELGLESYRTTG